MSVPREDTCSQLGHPARASTSDLYPVITYDGIEDQEELKLLLLGEVLQEYTGQCRLATPDVAYNQIQSSA